jgi:hypothetical protein
MVGFPKVSMAPAARRRLRRFLAHAFQTGSYTRLDSVPLARLDPEWADPELWLPAGLASFSAAREIRDELAYPLIVAVTFSLRGGSETPPRDAEQLTAELSGASPAVTLFEVGTPFLADPPVRDVNPARLGLPSAPDVGAELAIWEPPGEPPIRSLILSSHPRPLRAGGD